MPSERSTERGTIELLREAAEILRDPAGRAPEDVDAVAQRLETIAASAAEWHVSALLAMEAEQEMLPTSVLRITHGRMTGESVFLEADARAFIQTSRLLAQWLREAGFDREQLPVT